jgi:mannose/fructose/N-acetylgalactosamine-specific phosphotransferase system component IID
MWLAFLFIFGAIFVAIAGVLTGGIFTLVLVPIAIIAIVTAIVYAGLGYSKGAGTQQEVESAMSDPLPHSGHSNMPSRPNTPDDLVDARQQAQ